MELFPDFEETIIGVGQKLRAGDISCVGVVEQCLQKIDEWEPQIRAWVLIDRDAALARAREFDAELAAGQDRGELHGIPVGSRILWTCRDGPPRVVQLLGRTKSRMQTPQSWPIYATPVRCCWGKPSQRNMPRLIHR